MVPYANWFQNLRSGPMSMRVENNNQQLAIPTPNGLWSQYRNTGTTSYGADDDSSVFTLEIVKSQLQQKDQRGSASAQRSY